MTSAQIDSNQRGYPRIPKEVSVTVTKLEYPLPEDTGEAATLKNIATGGICLVVATHYETGTRLSLKINLKGWRRYVKSVAAIIDDSAGTVATTPLIAIAEVVWVNPSPDDFGYEVGVKFLDIYEDEYNALKKYLDNMADYLTR